VLTLTGRRRTEVLSLRRCDLMEENGTWYYAYRGKGGKRGKHELPTVAVDAIERGLEAWGKSLPTMQPEHSLWPTSGVERAEQGLGVQVSGVDIRKHQARRSRVVRAFLDENIGEDEYRRRLAEIDGQIQIAQPASLLTLEEAASLFNSLPDLWAEATLDEKGRLVAPLIERFYIDMEARRIGAMTPAPAFRTLLERALKRSRRSDVFLASFQELERREVWRWWRRGRVELPVQRRAHLRHYRHVRRFISSGAPSPARRHRT
jgi:hypothetical protein